MPEHLGQSVCRVEPMVLWLRAAQPALGSAPSPERFSRASSPPRALGGWRRSAPCERSHSAVRPARGGPRSSGVLRRSLDADPASLAVDRDIDDRLAVLLAALDAFDDAVGAIGKAMLAADAVGMKGGGDALLGGHLVLLGGGLAHRRMIAYPPKHVKGSKQRISEEVEAA